MKQLEVEIMGQSYLLGCPEGGQAQLLAAVEKVNAAMCKIRDSGKIKARDRIAILAAVNLAFESSEYKPPVAATSTSAESTQPQVSALLRRLDQALEADGQLL